MTPLLRQPCQHRQHRALWVWQAGMCCDASVCAPCSTEAAMLVAAAKAVAAARAAAAAADAEPASQEQKPAEASAAIRGNGAAGDAAADGAVGRLRAALEAVCRVVTNGLEVGFRESRHGPIWYSIGMWVHHQARMLFWMLWFCHVGYCTWRPHSSGRLARKLADSCWPKPCATVLQVLHEEGVLGYSSVGPPPPPAAAVYRCRVL